MLQTSAAIENLAVSTYKTALKLPYIGGSSANPVVKAFAQTTMAQHAQHAQAFNSAAQALGGKAQTNPDPKYLPVVNAAVTGISKDTPSAGALAVVELAMTLENVAAKPMSTTAPCTATPTPRGSPPRSWASKPNTSPSSSRSRPCSSAGAPQLIALNPTVVESLPAVAGSIAFPDAFYPTTSASPASQGALP